MLSLLKWHSKFINVILVRRIQTLSISQNIETRPI